MLRANDGTRTGGEILIDQLVIHGVQHVFCVPGESYLAALDAFYDRSIKLTVCRAEGGATMMAEAVGKATGRPGVVFCTRGPGATNASPGIHIAMQDSTPMIVFVGQVAREMREREAFQELDYKAVFGSMTKWATEIDDPARIPEIVSRAFYTACNGRPGPVVIALPEDMLVERVAVPDAPAFEPVEMWPGLADMARLQKLLWTAKSPIVLAGGSRWSEAACAALQRFAERFAVPVATTFRRAHLFDALHDCYAGDLGIGPNPKLVARIKAADLVVLIGGRMGELPSQSYSLFEIPNVRQTFVHVHPGSEELGRVLRSTQRRPDSVPRSKACSRRTTFPGARRPRPRMPIISPGPRRRRRSLAPSTLARSWCGCATISHPTPSSPTVPAISPPGSTDSSVSASSPSTSRRRRARWATVRRPRLA
jgi:acetolactate synthase I/II/III large subunit